MVNTKLKVLEGVIADVNSVQKVEKFRNMKINKQKLTMKSVNKHAWIFTIAERKLGHK